MIPQLPNEVIIEMTKRHHRIHHYLWHEVRNNWLDYDDATKNELRNEGWEPPRPALSKSDPETGGQTAILDNFSGEDFLFMHREMIKLVNEILNQVSDPQYSKVEGWKIIPRPGDVDYPVPPAWDGADPIFAETKSDEFFNTRFLTWERRYTDPNFLSQITLGELGSRLEFSIHNRMHLRWSSQPAAERPWTDPTNADTIDIQWDDPLYNYLADTYSSHVNPIFWKLHGWIDDSIEDWKNAHGITGDIQWTGTWMGHMHGNINANLLLRDLSTSRKDLLVNMSKVLKIISGKGKPHPFAIVDASLY